MSESFRSPDDESLGPLRLPPGAAWGPHLSADGRSPSRVLRHARRAIAEAAQCQAEAEEMARDAARALARLRHRQRRQWKRDRLFRRFLRRAGAWAVVMVYGLAVLIWIAATILGASQR